MHFHPGSFRAVTTRIIPLMALGSLITLSACSSQKVEGSRVADLILTNGRFYTMEQDQVWAQAVAIKGNKIVEVGSKARVDRWRGAGTRTINLKGAFVLPGMIDGHTHFNSAGRLLLAANLAAVSDEDGLREALKEAADRMEDGWSITGGGWGAYESWQAGSTGGEKEEAGELQELFRPAKDMIDRVTPDNPVLVNRWDGSMYLANSLALEMAGIDSSTVDPSGVTINRDSSGEPTGLIEGNRGAIMSLFSSLPTTSHERRLAESRMAFRKMAEAGITMFHDITPPDQLEIFQELYANGEVTARIRPRPTLEKAEFLNRVGITDGFGDAWLRFAGLKDFIDGIMGSWGAMFYEPYEDRPDHYGVWRVRVTPEPGIEEYMRRGYQAGFALHIHAIGDKGVDTLLTMYERVINEFDIQDHRWRVIHAQVVHDKDFVRFGEMGLVAEINPYHLSDDMRWMAERIGDRCSGAYAFRSLKDNGAVLVFGSDWPGTNAAIYHQHPRYLIHAAVNRTTLDGLPEGGWYPEQKITVHEAIEAFTINCAWATFEEDQFGSMKVGKYADFTVLDQNLIEIDPEDILKTEVLYTIVDGRIVYENTDR